MRYCNCSGSRRLSQTDSRPATVADRAASLGERRVRYRRGSTVERRKRPLRRGRGGANGERGEGEDANWCLEIGNGILSNETREKHYSIYQVGSSQLNRQKNCHTVGVSRLGQTLFTVEIISITPRDGHSVNQ